MLTTLALACVVSVFLPASAKAQLLVCDGDYGAWQRDPNKAQVEIYSEVGFAVGYDGATLWVGDSYMGEAFIDGKTLACKDGAIARNTGCYRERTSTSQDVSQEFAVVARGIILSGGGGTFRHRRKCWVKDAPYETSYSLWDWYSDEFYVAPPTVQPPNTPIVVPFGKKPEVKFTPPTMPFDINGDGNSEAVSWPVDGGFLVLDRDGDGAITSGRELYGDATFPGIKNGFDALAHESGKAVIEAGVPLYDALRVWADENQNGITDAGELRPFSDYIKRLFLFYDTSGKRDPNGNVRYFWKGEAVYVDGEQRPIYDVVVTPQQ